MLDDANSFKFSTFNPNTRCTDGDSNKLVNPSATPLNPSGDFRSKTMNNTTAIIPGSKNSTSNTMSDTAKVIT